jgi:hypothetical protein
MSVSSFSPCQTSARGSTAAHSVGLLYRQLALYPLENTYSSTTGTYPRSRSIVTSRSAAY